jgi:HAD superfamily hydrolase (TIGR01458 family)
MRVDAVLLDLDGTLYVGDAPLPGAVAAVGRLKEQRVPLRFLTNTTRLSHSSLAQQLQRMGFPIALDELFTASIAATRWLKDTGIQRISLYLSESAHEDFSEFELDEHAPEAIVVGDLGEGWTYARLNTAFRQLLDGAGLVALQKNRYWRTPDGFALDAGAFVAALEYAAQREAVIIGKPSKTFFRLAAESLGVSPEHIAVIGDDIEADVGGAQGAGLHAALVRTGKFRPDVLATSGIQPDWIADSLGDLIDQWYPTTA